MLWNTNHRIDFNWTEKKMSNYVVYDDALSLSFFSSNVIWINEFSKEILNKFYEFRGKITSIDMTHFSPCMSMDFYFFRGFSELNAIFFRSLSHSFLIQIIWKWCVFNRKIFVHLTTVVLKRHITFLGSWTVLVCCWCVIFSFFFRFFFFSISY